MVVKKNMQNSFPYIDILIFGVIAIFLIFRLKNILGTKTGFEETNTKQKWRNFFTQNPCKIQTLSQIRFSKFLIFSPKCLAHGT